LKVARTLPLGALALALPVLLLWRCAHDAAPAAAPDTAAPSPSPAAVAHDTAALAPAPPPTRSAAAAPSEPAASSAATAALAPAAPSSSSAARIISAVAQSDPRDLELLMRIERELKRNPPASVHELIRLHKAGATAESLRARARELPDSDLPLRMLVLRWVDEVDQPAHAPPTKPAVATPSGSAQKLVRPIQPAQTP
jgi:hypothetical protein